MRIPAFAVASLCLVTSASPQDRSPTHGGIAPPDAWYTQGGCAARTGVSLTQPLARQPRVAWTFQGVDPLVGEPLAWGNLVVLEENGGPKQRTLHVLRLRDGKPHLKPLSLRCDRALRPCIWEDRIAIRFGPDKVRVLSIGAKRTSRVYEVRFRDAPVLAPLLIGDELYILTEGSLERHSVRQKKRLWQVEGQFGGIPSVLGEHVFAVRQLGTNGLVLQVTRKDGKRVGQHFLATDPEAFDAVDPKTAQILVADTCLLVYRCPPPKGTIGREQAWQNKNVEFFARRSPDLAVRRASYALSAPPCLTAKHFYALSTNSGERRSGSWLEGELENKDNNKKEPRLGVLADSEREAKLLEFTASATVAGDVSFLGTLAFNVHSNDILWRRPHHKLATRVVPARNTLLVREGSSRLVALGRRALLGIGHRPADEPVARHKLTGEVAARQAVWVLRNGTVAAGNVVVSPTSAKVTFGKGRHQETRPLVELLLLVEPKKQFLYWSGSPRQLEFAFAQLIDRQVTRAYVSLVKQAAETNDAYLMTRLRGVALARGAVERELQAVEKRLTVMKVRTLRRVPAKVRKVLDQESRIVATAIASMWKPFLAWSKQVPPEHRAALFNSVLRDAPTLYDKIWPEMQALHSASSPAEQAAAIASVAAFVPGRALGLWAEFKQKLDAASPEAQARMARAVLEADPQHAAAAALVRKLVPPSIKISGEFVTLDWLDLVQVLHSLKVKQVEQPPPDKFVLPYDQRQLIQYQRQWRKDLVAFRSERLLVVSPCKNPKGIAQCLSLGELVCSALDEIFAAGTRKRAEDLPMRLLLYETKKEYQKFSVKGKWKSHLVWSWGHYDGDASRMYVPVGEGAFEQVMQVFAHELTHQWIDARCPMFTSDDRTKAIRKEVPGEWIVEGFASMVEGFQFDLVNRTYRPSHPRMPRLDIVANSRRNQLLSWGHVLTSTYEQKHRRFSATTKNRIVVQTTWDLGVSPVLTPMGLFYAQSTAACHYLFSAQGGRYRKQLLEYVAARYTGQIEKLDIETAFGMTARQLGRRAVEHARKVVARKR